MRKLLFLLCVIPLFTSCEKLQLGFNSKAEDKLIHPDIDLQATNWIKLDSLTANSLSDVSFSDEKNGMISGFGGIVYITKNGGETWRTINTNANMTFLSIYSLDEKTFFTARKGLYKSTDYGNSWRVCKLPDVSVFEIWFKDSKNGFLSSGNGSYRTTDAGETWTKISDATAKNLQFTSEDIGYFTYGSTAIYNNFIPGGTPTSSGDIYRTTNGGKTWKKMGLKVREIKSLSFISDKVGFFATNDCNFYKTSDGGETCTLIGKKEFLSADLFFVNENQGLACTGNGILITLDGGETFTPEYVDNGNGQIFDFEFPSPAAGYAIGNNGMILKRIQ